MARGRAGTIVIRFFDPPEFETDIVELCKMEVGERRMVPDLRCNMSRDYYRLIVADIGCR